MGIEWAESFAGWNSATMTGLYSNPANPSTPQPGAPNGQMQYPLNGPGTTLPKTLSADMARVLTGYRWLYNGGSGDFLRIMDTSAVQLRLSVDVAGRVTITGLGTLFTSAPGLIRQGTWNYVELDATINGATGSVLFRVNGAAVATLANVNTRGGSANDTANIVMPMGVGVDWMTDWYILNATGTPNALLGDVVGVPLRPASAGPPRMGPRRRRVEDRGRPGRDPRRRRELQQQRHRRPARHVRQQPAPGVPGRDDRGRRGQDEQPQGRCRLPDHRRHVPLRRHRRRGRRAARGVLVGVDRGRVRN